MARSNLRRAPQNPGKRPCRAAHQPACAGHATCFALELMHRTHTLALLIALAAFGGLPAAGCGGAVDPGTGGYPGGGGSSSSGTTSSSSSSSSGGSGSSGSSGGPTTSPECVGLAVPAIASICPDGSAASAYYAWDGAKCVLAYACSSTPAPAPPVPLPGYPPYGSSSSSSSSGGIVTPTPPVCNFALPNICEACSNGETICAHYAIQNGSCVVEICPPTYVPPPSPPSPPIGGTCSQGAACSPGEGCGTASASGGGCSTSCMCDYTGYFQCTNNCTPYPPPPIPPPYMGCSQGASCSYGTGCGSGPDYYGCFTSCTCDYYGTLQCNYSCGGSGSGSSSGGGYPVYDSGVGIYADGG